MKLDDENLDPGRRMECREPDLAASKIDMVKSISWGGWLARAKIDQGFYSSGPVNEIEERKMFEEHWNSLGDGDKAA